MEFTSAQKIKTSPLGYGKYLISSGKVFGNIPYPLGFVHWGNQSLFLSMQRYNTMNFFEFISHQFASLQYEHHFEGTILNRIPLVNKLNLRLVSNFSILFGDWDNQLRKISPLEVQKFHVANNPPFAEVGYGVENIFKFFRIEVFHRLTYTNLPRSQNFAVKGSVQFNF